MRRLIFSLLYDRGKFTLSRNFRLQHVGDVEWLFRNYDFAAVSRGLDELMVIDASRGQRDANRFSETVQHIASRCYIPLTVGGGIKDFSTAQRYLRSGADKLLINSAFESDPGLVAKLARHLGRQCIVAGVDYRSDARGNRSVFVDNGQRRVRSTISEWAQFLQECGAGEILLQSIGRDGTGMGTDTDVLSDLAKQPNVPCILMGGVGKTTHIVEALQTRSVDAVSTANLLNFIGSTFLGVRESLAAAGISIPSWDPSDFVALRDSLAPNASAPGAHRLPLS